MSNKWSGVGVRRLRQIANNTIPGVTPALQRGAKQELKRRGLTLKPKAKASGFSLSSLF